jgi:hypothetical protein
LFPAKEKPPCFSSHRLAWTGLFTPKGRPPTPVPEWVCQIRSAGRKSLKRTSASIPLWGCAVQTCLSGGSAQENFFSLAQVAFTPLHTLCNIRGFAAFSSLPILYSKNPSASAQLSRPKCAFWSHVRGPPHTSLNVEKQMKIPIIMTTSIPASYAQTYGGRQCWHVCAFNMIAKLRELGVPLPFPH